MTSLRKRHLAEYTAWWCMIDRCTNPQHPAYRYYGGRGITVCERWQKSFAEFFADMGPKHDPALTLDRIDNDGHYEPGNCRWATWVEQMRNRRPGGIKSKHMITLNGMRKSMNWWCRQYGHNYTTVKHRINKLGWGIRRALTTPTKGRIK